MGSSRGRGWHLIVVDDVREHRLNKEGPADGEAIQGRHDDELERLPLLRQEKQGVCDDVAEVEEHPGAVLAEPLGQVQPCGAPESRHDEKRRDRGAHAQLRRGGTARGYSKGDTMWGLSCCSKGREGRLALRISWCGSRAEVGRSHRGVEGEGVLRCLLAVADEGVADVEREHRNEGAEAYALKRPG